MIDKLVFILGILDLCFLLCLSSCIENLWLYLFQWCLWHIVKITVKCHFIEDNYMCSIRTAEKKKIRIFILHELLLRGLGMHFAMGKAKR